MEKFPLNTHTLTQAIKFFLFYLITHSNLATFKIQQLLRNKIISWTICKRSLWYFSIEYEHTHTVFAPNFKYFSLKRLNNHTIKILIEFYNAMCVVT